MSLLRQLLSPAPAAAPGPVAEPPVEYISEPSGERSITSIDDYVHQLSQWAHMGSTLGVQQTLSGSPAERITNSLEGYATSAYAANGVIFATMLARMMVFSGVRLTWQSLSSSGPSRLFGTADLEILENPWSGGTTQDLLIRMITDVDLAGNFYATVVDGEIVRLRPDWVTMVLEPRRFRGGVLGHRLIGYLYQESGEGDYIPLLPDEVARFAPIPDPLATYRGMSWLTPVLREIRIDGQMNHHKSQFFTNAATPNLAVSLKETVTVDQFKEFMEVLDASHTGIENAYKTMYLGGGADVTVVGASFEAMNFKQMQGHGETRIAAAGGVPPVIVGLSEGLQAATYSNYAQARRRFADGTVHPLWQNAVGSLAPLLPRPSGARLWYDARHVPFLREDTKDEADIQGREAATIAELVKEGFTPASVVNAVRAHDWTLLEHTGALSIQLQPTDPAAATDDEDDGEPAPDPDDDTPDEGEE
ncbi:phage portal protein [Nocardiopsis sp. NPDC057823]|uniref:phage portal protein n=1 Tax=Nocardiopsis sp. NPDC057823 TaxID=3346256 RepID=UPI00366D9040